MGVAGAPDDLEILEFALKWRINPEEIRREWTIRDMRWLSVVEEAQGLAQPEIQKRIAQRTAQKPRKR